MKLPGRFLLLFLSTVLTLAALEAAFRVARGIPLLTTDNLLEWRLSRLHPRAKGSDEYHPLLGWAHPANFGTGEEFGTGAYGIRLNGHPLPEAPTGAVLACGDSFTEGVEVPNNATWPAHLERILGRPVLNAGTGGYGSDQIVLRAESLLPVLRPREIIVSFFIDDIGRAEFSTLWGASKPYFVVEDGRLSQRNDPVPRFEVTPAVLGPWRAVLGHFALANFVLERLSPRWGDAALSNVQVHRDGLAVSRLLLTRLKERADAGGARLVFMMQYRAESLRDGPEEPEAGRLLIEHARALGIATVDTRAALQREWRARGDEALREYFLPGPGGAGYGHMSAAGNEFLARLLAPLLAG